VDADLTLALAEHLASPAGAALLEAAGRARALPALARGRAIAALGTPEQVRAALRQADLRELARAKTPHAARLLFTRAALEQASAWPVALERAARFGLAAGERLADLTAGVGLDALAAAEAGLDVRAVERDPLRARLLALNAAALGLARRVEVRCGDAQGGAEGAAAVFLDPDRRPAGRRTRDAALFEPPREAWDRLAEGARRVIVKAPPAGDESLPADLPFEVVSLAGEAKERRLLWRGFDAAPARRALALPSGLAVEGDGRAWPAPRAPREGDLLLDPDVSVVRARGPGGRAGGGARARARAPPHRLPARRAARTQGPGHVAARHARARP
jgi:hypothetical protein